MNQIRSITTDQDRTDWALSPGISDSSLAEEILEHLRMAVPYHVTFIDGIPRENKAAVEAELKKVFELWANSWIAPKCRRIIENGRVAKIKRRARQ